MCSVLHFIKNEFSEAISITLNEKYTATVVPANPKFGDYQCNDVMSLIKKRPELQPAKDLAEQIVSHLKSSDEFDVTIAPNGFITITLSDSLLQKLVLTKPSKEKDEGNNKITWLIDYSSPNIAKEMHVGHLRSTVLGECICRILEYRNFKVRRINHLGDYGTQFGMLIQYLKEKYSTSDDFATDLSDLTKLYKEAQKRFTDDPDFKVRAQLAVVKLQSGDEFSVNCWKKICLESRKSFQEIYDLFDINLIDRGESFYSSMIPEVIAEAESRGILKVSDGAKCVFLEGDDVPLILVKSDGGYGYDSTDFACIKHRLVVEKNDMVLVITDPGQQSHFKKIYQAAELMGWYDPSRQKCLHIFFGLVQAADGKKFKTRSGDSVKLIDLIDEAVSRAKTELLKRNENIETEDIQKNAVKIAVSAIRYFDLKQNRETNYKFSFDKMLDPRGNTAVYLLYAYARINSIFRKACINEEDIVVTDLSPPFSKYERDLVLHLVKFSDVINIIIQDFFVHRLTDYIYHLSELFTLFYQNCKVLQSENENSRLSLCKLTKEMFEVMFKITLKILQTCFQLLSIKPLEKI